MWCTLSVSRSNTELSVLGRKVQKSPCLCGHVVKWVSSVSFETRRPQFASISSLLQMSSLNATCLCVTGVLPRSMYVKTECGVWVWYSWIYQLFSGLLSHVGRVAVLLHTIKLLVYQLKKKVQKKRPSMALLSILPFHHMLHHTRKPVMFLHGRNEAWIVSNLPETINQSELYAISSSLLTGRSPQAVSVSTKHPDAKQNWQRGDWSVQPQCCAVCVCLCMVGWVRPVLSHMPKK